MHPISIARPRPRPRRAPATLAALILAAGLGVAACGADDATTEPGAGGSDTAGGADPAQRLDESVLQGEAATVDGSTLDLASLAGNDLVVWFWAPW